MSDRQAEFNEVFERAYKAVCSLSVGDIDSEDRRLALKNLDSARIFVIAGLQKRARERIAEAALATLTKEQVEAIKRTLGEYQ